MIRAISAGLYRFCEWLDAEGLDGTRIGARGAIYTGEGLTPAQRRLIERVLGCPTICEYGCGELGILAFECPSRGLHLMHENMVFEFLVDGRPARPGEQASLVVTNLNSFVSPLVRYSLGDLVVPSEKSCECGRPQPLLDAVIGRVHDRIRSPGGRMINSLYFTHLFDELPSVHRALGGEVEVTVVQVDTLPVSRNGKTPWIVSEIEPRTDRAPEAGVQPSDSARR